MTLLHARYLEPEALREHLRRDVLPALEGTRDTGVLDDVAASALVRAVLDAGEPGGVLDLEGASDDWEPRFLELASIALGDDAVAAQLLEGGWLDRRGVGAYTFGSLPVRIAKRHLTRATRTAAREAVQLGWESELLNLLESAAMRFDRAPEEHLVLLRHAGPVGRRSETAPREPHHDLTEWLLHADGADLTLTEGLPPHVHGLTSLRALPVAPLSRDAVKTALAPWLPEEMLERREVSPVSIDVPAVGRVRVTLTTESGRRAASLRVLPSQARALDALPLSPVVQASLLELKQGLVLISGAPGSGRSTSLGAVLQQLASQGRRVATIEEPIHTALTSSHGLVRQLRLGFDASPAEFARAIRLMPLDVVAVDLVDDEVGLELALEASVEGRLVFCTFRAPNVASAVHRASVLDARYQRRRLAEQLSAVWWQHLPVREGRAVFEVDFHLPTVALRRHLRAHDTPPPPVVFETEA